MFIISVINAIRSRLIIVSLTGNFTNVIFVIFLRLDFFTCFLVILYVNCLPRDKISEIYSDMQINYEKYSYKHLLSKNLKFLRLKAGLNQEELAKIVDLNRDNITSYERGIAPKIDVLLKIVKYFQITVEIICELDLEKKENLNIELYSSEALKKGTYKKSPLLSEEQERGNIVQKQGQEVDDLKKEVNQLKSIIQMQETTIKAYESAIRAQETTIETLKNANFPKQVPVSEVSQ